MTSSELHRKLLYNGYTELSDYLKNSLVNRYIYNLLLKLQNEQRITTPILTIFNEVYYQCVRVQSDGTPAKDLSRRYFDEEEDWLGPESGHDNLLVFCLVWVLVKRKIKPLYYEDLFLQHLEPLIDCCEFHKDAIGLLRYMEKEDIYSPYKFSTRSCPISDIPMRIDLKYRTDMTLTDRVKTTLSLPVESSPIDFNPWRKVTDNFSEKSITFFVMLYKNRQDQLRLIERIEKACTRNEYKKLADFFLRLRNHIREGSYVNQSIPYSHTIDDVVYGTTGEWQDYRDRFMTLLDESESWVGRYWQLQKKHKTELEIVEAKYQAELEQLKLRLDGASKQEKRHHTTDSSHEELSLNIADMVAHIKKTFSKDSALEFITMYYQLATEHGIPVDAKTSKLLDGIMPAIIQRDNPRMTYNIDYVQQLNTNPHQVINRISKEEE